MNAVDVLVPCYNYGRFLERCVASALSQEGVAVRVLIIDDSSTDDSPEVGRRLAAADSRVEFRRHQANKGHIATYNEGLLEWASADYSMLLSADDALTPGALLRAVTVLNAHPEAGMVYGRALIVGDQPAPRFSEADGSTEFHVMTGLEFLQHCCAHANPVPAPGVVVRTSLQHRLGGYRPHLPHSGDLEMWMRFATQGPVVVLRAVQAYYRWHGGNMGSSYYNTMIGDLREQKAACDEALTVWGGALPEVDALSKVATRRVAEKAFWMASKAFDAGDAERTRVCLQFALEVDEQLRWTRTWWRFQAKRLVGHALWCRLKAVVDRARGKGSVAPVVSHQFQIGDTTGWWPGSAS